MKEMNYWMMLPVTRVVWKGLSYHITHSLTHSLSYSLNYSITHSLIDYRDYLNRDYLIEIPPEKWLGLNVESASDSNIKGKIIAKSKLHTIVTIETIFGDEVKCKSNILALSDEQDEPEVAAD